VELNSRETKITMDNLGNGNGNGDGGLGNASASAIVRRLRRVMLQVTLACLLIMLGCSYTVMQNVPAEDRGHMLNMLCVVGPLLGLLLCITCALYGQHIADVLLMMLICMLCMYVLGWCSQLFTGAQSGLSREDMALVARLVSRIKAAEAAVATAAAAAK
jgi:hypothetical protein